MNNRELGEFIASENYSSTTNELLKKSEDIIGVGADIASSAFLGFPVVSILKPFIEGIKDWKSRVELKQLAYYFKEFESLNQSERSEFSLMIQKNEEDFTERLFYYITQLNDKRKASLCGKIGVNYARKKIGSQKFLRLIEVIKSLNSSDLLELKKILSKEGEELLKSKVDPTERKKEFMSKMFCHRIFLSHHRQLKANLKTAHLLEAKLDYQPYEVSPARPTIDEIVQAINKIRFFDYFTEIAYELYQFGLKED